MTNTGFASAAAPRPLNVRARAPLNRAPSAPSQPGATSDWMRTGARAVEGLETARQEQDARREEALMRSMTPRRFRLQKGQRRDVFILDVHLGPCIYEHNLTFRPEFKRLKRRNDGGQPFPQDIYVTSPKEWEEDPITRAFGYNPVYTMYLSIVEFFPNEPIQTQRGVVTRAKRLMGLKGEALAMFLVIHDQMAQQHPEAPLRGLQLLMSRGHDDQSLSTGMPMVVAWHGDAPIWENFSHPAVQSERDGAIIRPENDDCVPYDYAAIFPRPSAAEIVQRFPQLAGAAPVPGSPQANQQVWAPPAQNGQPSGFAPAQPAPAQPAQTGFAPAGAAPPLSSLFRTAPAPGQPTHPALPAQPAQPAAPRGGFASAAGGPAPQFAQAPAAPPAGHADEADDEIPY